MELPIIYVKKNEERRIRGGHPWVYSNEVDTRRSPLKGLEPGRAVVVRSAREQVLGTGYVNPGSLISVRLYTREAGVLLDQALIASRLRQALELRERVYPTPHYRLVYGESDGLPGLVADRYGELVVCQFTTAGMERVAAAVLAALDQVLAPRVVVLRNDTSARALEGLDSRIEEVKGASGDNWDVEENGGRFRFSPLSGHKTGWYLDHRANRAALAPFVAGARVLDLFSYAGAWGIQAARAGARSVTCVDASAAALERVAENAQLNGVADRVAVHRGDAFDLMKSLADQGDVFDVVILDPPAFIKRSKDLDQGGEAYRRANALAAGLVADGGFLASSSCSYRLDRGRLVDLVARAAHRGGRFAQVVAQGGQGPDHPVHPRLPESEYLKMVVARLTGEPEAG